MNVLSVSQTCTSYTFLSYKKTSEYQIYLRASDLQQHLSDILVTHEKLVPVEIWFLIPIPFKRSHKQKNAHYWIEEGFY